MFALTSDGGDFYSAMTRVAVGSLRLTNPAIRLLIACDPQTDRNIRARHDRLIDEVDDWLVIDTPSGDNSFRNRYVKLSLRQKVTGAFLFLDSDVLVRGPLDDVFSIRADLAAARNHSRAKLDEQIWSEDLKALDGLGWSTRPDVYVNGGVLYYADTDGARRFAREWMTRWRESYSRTGRYRDQPALNAALKGAKPDLLVLDDRFNAQFKVTASVALNPLIWHYYSSQNAPPNTVFDLLVHDLLKGKPLVEKRLIAAVRSPYPWRQSSPIDRWAAERIVRQGHFGGLPAYWLMRRFRIPGMNRLQQWVKSKSTLLGVRS